MRIYFSATITENQARKTHYKRILDYFRKEGHKVLEYGSDLELSNLINQDLNLDELRNQYKELDSFLKNSDVYVADVSEPSVSIGYEISQAVLLRKPVLVLKHQDSSFHPLSTIKGNKASHLKYKEYNDRTLDMILKNFLSDAKDKIDTKFILIFPSVIDRYLEWNARERGIAKAEVTRESIEKVMASDKKYQEYLKSEGINQ
jgi:hypothetical protein